VDLPGAVLLTTSISNSASVTGSAALGELFLTASVGASNIHDLTGRPPMVQVPSFREPAPQSFRQDSATLFFAELEVPCRARSMRYRKQSA
jgi:hypothetical protein